MSLDRSDTDQETPSGPRKIHVLKGAGTQVKTGKRFPIDRTGLRFLARTIDMFVGFALLAITNQLLALDLLNQTLRVSLPYIVIPISAFMAMRIAGTYRFAFEEHPLTHMIRAVWGAAFGISVPLIASHIFKLGYSLNSLLEFAAITLITYTALHAYYVAIVRALTRSGALSDNVVIIGATPAASKLIERNSQKRELNILGVFEERLDRAPSHLKNVPILGKVDDLLEWDQLPKVDRIVVTVTSTAQDRVRSLIDRLRQLPQEIILVLDLDGFNPEQTSIANLIDIPATYVSGAPKDIRRAAVKRVLDIVVSTGMLLFFAPVMFIIAIAIKLDSPGPVFFRQKRHGFNNQTIRVWKFRTMRHENGSESGEKIVQTFADDKRVTRVGSLLRITSADELPQLMNILVGEMSLVGPRPHAVGMTTEEVEVHNIVSEYAHRHRMKPGLTGWAQINGSRGPVHTAEEVRQRVRYDMEYMRKASLWFDIYVIIMTAPCLLGDTKAQR